MRIILWVLLLLPLSLHAAELSEASLQGSWLIVQFQGEPDDEGDKWEFEGNRFYQNLGGRRISPDEFTAAGGVIDLGYAKINVKHFDGQVMEAEMAGFDYRLEKQ